MSARQFLRVARALALGSGLASCASAVVPSGTPDAERAADAPTACDTDAASARHFIDREPMEVFTRYCPANIGAASGACDQCVYCAYDNPTPTGDCSCAGPGSRWACQFRRAPLPPPELGA